MRLKDTIGSIRTLDVDAEPVQFQAPDVFRLTDRPIRDDLAVDRVTVGGTTREAGPRTVPLKVGSERTPLSAPVGDEPLHGPVEPAIDGLAPVDLVEALPLTGVGYALYRIGKRCVALAGPRGDGWIGCVATPAPELLVGSLRWIREMRSHTAGT